MRVVLKADDGHHKQRKAHHIAGVVWRGGGLLQKAAMFQNSLRTFIVCPRKRKPMDTSSRCEAHGPSRLGSLGYYTCVYVSSVCNRCLYAPNARATVTFTKKRLPGGLTRVAKMQGLKPPSRASSRLVGADRPAYDESARSPKRKKYVRLPTPAFSRDPTVNLSHTWLLPRKRLEPVLRLLGMLFFARRVCWEMGGIESGPWLHGHPC